MKTRQEANRELVKLLSEIVEKQPEQRFGQILRNYGFIEEQSGVIASSPRTWKNEFNSEPQYILERVRDILDAFNNLKR